MEGCSAARGRGAAAAAQGAYEENYYPFAQQLPTFPGQNALQMQQWGQQMNPDMFARYNYPNASVSGSPMNFGAWYPPTTYAPSPNFNNTSNGPSYRGVYPTTTGPTAFAPSYGTAPSFPGGYNNTGHPANSAGGADPAMLAAMANLNFGDK